MQSPQQTPADDPVSPARPSLLRRLLSWAGGLVIAYVALTLVLKFARQLSFPHILESARNTPPLAIAGGIALVMLSFALLSLFDLLALRHAGEHHPYRKVLLVSFLSFALGNAVGSNMIAGGAVRYHLYGKLGIPARARLGIIGFVAATTSSGLLVLVAIAGLLAQDFLLQALDLPPWSSTLIALASFLLLIGYLGVTLRNWPLPGWIASRIRLPSGGTALAQVGLSASEWLVLAGLLYLLLPGAAVVGYFGILLAYLVAFLAGTVSNVPGGIGVMETMLSLLLGSHIAPEQVVASMLVFRLLLHLLPLLIAVPIGLIQILSTPKLRDEP